MKTKILSALAALMGTFSAYAQIPSAEVNLSDLTFVRQNFCRHFYDSQIVMSELKMDGPELFLKNSANLIVEGEIPSVQDGIMVFPSAHSVVRIGSFHPYYCYEAHFSALNSGGIRFYSNDGKSALEITRENGRIVASLDGKTLSSKPAVCSDGAFSLRVQYTGARFHVFELYGRTEWKLHMSVEADMRSVETPLKWSWGIVSEGPASLLKAFSALTCGTGQADPQIVQHKDGSPYIRDGRLYVCFTTRGFERIPDSYQGVYSLGLPGCDLRLEGALLFGDADGVMHGYHATKVVFDDDKGEWLVMTTTHGGNHTLAWASTKADILHGVNYLDVKELDFPHNWSANPAYNTEDPDFFYDSKAKKWRLAYCAVIGNEGAKSYRTFLTESRNWNGPYKQIAQSSKDNNTGIRITTVGGKRYVLSGGPDTTFYIYLYPTLEYVGTFNQQYANGGFRGWPTIVPIPFGNYERYLWITFDRGAITGRYSYGTLYFYLGDKMFLNKQ